MQTPARISFRFDLSWRLVGAHVFLRLVNSLAGSKFGLVCWPVSRSRGEPRIQTAMGRPADQHSARAGARQGLRALSTLMFALLFVLKQGGQVEDKKGRE